MKKVYVLGLLISMLMTSTAFADILPEGQKYVPVCAYFNNTEDFLDTSAIYGYETAPGGSKVDFSSFIANECFRPTYKFNQYGVYGVTADHALTLDYDTYDPTTDAEAYPTNIKLEMGDKLVPDTDTTERITNEYAIIELDLVNKVLVVEPVKTTKYFTDESSPEVTEGTVTVVSESGDDTGDDVTDDTEGEDIFSDISVGNDYYDALKYLKDNGIIGGYSDGSYKPDNPVNRAEFTKIIIESTATDEEISDCGAHYANQSDTNITLFSDVVFTMGEGNTPEWYFNYVCMAKLNNIVGGYPDGSFKPAQDINFVEAAKIITEAMGYEMQTSDPWYESYVTELENHKAIPTTISSLNKKLTRGEMAEIMYRLMAGVENLTSKTYDELE